MSDQNAQKEMKEKGQEILQDLLRLMGFDAKVGVLDQPEGEILLQIESPDAGRLIGRDAQGLEALQLVVNRMAGRQFEQSLRFIVDVERYRERKKEHLLKMARDAADQVRQTGHSVRLPPMSASDRRVIHQAILDQKDLRTWSEILDDEHQKRVVVDKAESASMSETPPADNLS